MKQFFLAFCAATLWLASLGVGLVVAAQWYAHELDVVLQEIDYFQLEGGVGVWEAQGPYGRRVIASMECKR